MKNVSKKLGVDTKGQPLTKSLCMSKVKKLRAAIKAGTFDEKPALRKYAVYYAGWYTWRARQFDEKPAAKKTVKKTSGKKAAGAPTFRKAA